MDSPERETPPSAAGLHSRCCAGGGQLGFALLVAHPDVVEGGPEDGRVHDLRRIDYLRKHIAQVGRARADGMAVDGYFYWSFMDNFEWSLGYRPRFGLVHVDFGTQRRTIKDSGHWFRAFLSA